LHGGDDYELCFTAPSRLRTTIESIATELQLPITAIGEIIADKTLSQRAGNGAITALLRSGYQHF
jgi:thiamine-monophosphate kinase